MFRDDAQRARVCKVLLTRVPRRIAEAWNGDPGPGDLAHHDLHGCSTYERVMVGIAMQLWTGGIKDTRWDVRLDDLFGLDGTNLRLVGTFVVALGRDSRQIDAWLLENEP